MKDIIKKFFSDEIQKKRETRTVYVIGDKLAVIIIGVMVAVLVGLWAWILL